MLTRLDLGHFEPFITPYSIPLPITLEILSLSPCILHCITRPPPPGLCVLIIEADVFSEPPLVEELRLYATEAPILMKVALIDFCIFFFFPFFLNLRIIVYLVPDNLLLIPFFLHQLTPHVNNVCFKYSRSDGQAISRLQHTLNLYDIGFKKCTILLPEVNLTQVVLQPQVEVFTRLFNFNATVVHTRHARVTYHRVDETVLEDWGSIVD